MRKVTSKHSFRSAEHIGYVYSTGTHLSNNLGEVLHIFYIDMQVHACPYTQISHVPNISGLHDHVYVVKNDTQ